MQLLSKYTFHIYVALWFLYGLQTTLMLTGITAQMIFVVLMVMSFHACYMVNRYYRIGPYVKWLNVMLVVLTIYGLANIVSGEAIHKGRYASNVLDNFKYLQHIYMSVMPIYAFYFYTAKRRLCSQNIIYVFFVLLFFSVVSYYQQFFKVSIRLGKDDIVNNMGYLFVPLIPMLSLIRMKNVWRYTLALVIFGFIMLSMKRGAILSGTVMLLLFVRHHIKVRTKAQLASVFTLLFVVIFVIYRFVMYLYTANAFFQRRLLLTMGGYSSRRDIIYDFFWHYYTEKTSVTEFLFGHGANGTVSIFITYAHNDWLEFAINQGLLGIFLYVIYWCTFVWEWNNYKGPNDCKKTLGDIIIAYFLITLFSMSFGNMPLAASLCIGYCIAMNKKQRFITLYENTNYHTRLS